ncbi:MAG: hypothetical protein WC612_03995 [Bdellovibrionales bacterium]|jgi:hypothetical protein
MAGFSFLSKLRARHAAKKAARQIEKEAQNLLDAATKAEGGSPFDNLQAFVLCYQAMDGRDLLAEANINKFYALPVEVRNSMLTDKEYGEYGATSVAMRDDVNVMLTLRLVAQEICPKVKALRDGDLARLSTEATREAISARYPSMPPQRIDAILKL